MSDFEITGQSGPNSLEGNPIPGMTYDNALDDADTSHTDFFTASNLIALPLGDILYPELDLTFSSSDNLMEVQDDLSSGTFPPLDLAMYPQRIGKHLDFPARDNIPAIADANNEEEEGASCKSC
jgi:hypothetical protein